MSQSLFESVRVGSAKAAASIGITMPELKRLRRAGVIPYYRIGHRTVVYNVSDLEAYLESVRVPARGAA